MLLHNCSFATIMSGIYIFFGDRGLLKGLQATHRLRTSELTGFGNRSTIGSRYSKLLSPTRMGIFLHGMAGWVSSLLATKSTVSGGVMSW